MTFWETLTQQLKKQGFSDAYIQQLLKLFGTMPTEDFVRLSPAKLAEAITAGWHNDNDGAGLGFMATPDDAADLLRIATKIHSKLSRQHRPTTNRISTQPITLTINEADASPAKVTENSMNFWKTHTKELKSIGFTTEQIKAMENQFPDLDAAAILKNPKKVLASMPGDDQGENRKKLDALLEKVKQLQTGTGKERPTSSQASFTVSGLIIETASDKPLANVIVRAFVRKIGQEILLGEATSKKDGQYTITVTPGKNFQSVRKGFHLMVRAYTERNTLLGSEIAVNVTTDQKINLKVKKIKEPSLTVFEQLTAKLAPMLGNQTLAELNEDDIKILAADANINPDQVVILQQSTRLARETELPAEIFHALASQKLPLELEKLLEQSDEEIHTAVEAALEKNVIPEMPDGFLGSVLARFEHLSVEQGLLLQHEITGQLQNQETDKPLAGFTVRIVDLSAQKRDRESGLTSTDQAGKFSITYTARPRSRASRSFRLHILDRQGKELHTTEVTAQSGQAKLDAPISIKLPPIERPSPKIAELASTLRLNLAPELSAALARHKITTLNDVRLTGGLDRLKDAAVGSDDPAVMRLQAHADLMVLSDDIKVNDALIDKGYDSMLSISNTSRKTFVDATGEFLSKDEAERNHSLAIVQIKQMGNAETSIRAYAKSADKSGKNSREEFPPVEDETTTTCACETCNSAVSPGAYLADLLDYTLKFVKKDPSGQSIDLNFLTQEFHTAFAELPHSCEASDKKFKQIRLLIEVLRDATLSLTDTTVINILKRSEQEYCDQAYESLLIQLGISFEELRQARGYSSEKRAELAERLGFHPLVGATDRIEVLTLPPKPANAPGERTEEKLEKLFGLAPTIRPASFTDLSPQKTPDIAKWRLEYLRSLWSKDDWQLNNTFWDGPVIDPDLIGPDDFRQLDTAPNAPFTLWNQRRDQIDRLLGDLKQEAPDLPGMLSRTYGSPIPDFDNLAVQLNTNPQPDDMAQIIQTSTGLSTEAFRRLVELRQNFQQQTQPLDEADWAELASILIQAVKARDPNYYQAWVVEEQQIGLSLDNRIFWISLSEPAVGAWPPPDMQARALIDPELVRTVELRDVTVAGKAAHELWQERANALETLVRDLRELIPGAHVAGMIKLAVSLPEDENTINDDLEQINSAIDRTVSVQRLRNKYHLTAKEFLSLWNLRALATGNTSPPANEDWDQGINILKKAYKHQQGWKQAEGNLKYWQVLRMHLAPWRAALAERQRWQTRLTTNSRQPIVDPNLLDNLDFILPLEQNSGWAVFSERRQWITKERNNLVARRQSFGANIQNWLDQELESIGFSHTELIDLKESSATESISARLLQINLPRAGFNRLYMLHRLLESGQSLEAHELDEIENIIIQVRKQRQYTSWNDEEVTKQITLSPDLFRVRQQDLPFLMPSWSGAASFRRSWEQKLSSRIEQERGIHNALEAAVKAAEEASLPILREGLVYAAYMQAHPVTILTSEHMPDKNKQTRHKWVTANFLIDSATASCKETTRIQQAIETLQSLLWSIRNGLLSETGRKLKLDTEYFDDEWRWLGSYASWRGAVLAFIYPENILLPSLRKRQTPGFEMLVQQLRMSGQVTPDVAERAAQVYSDYWLDVLDMRVEASVSIQYGFSQADLIILFGWGPTTRRMYWTSFQSNSTPSYWEPVPGMEDTSVSKVIGACQYKEPSNNQRVLVFVKGQKGGESQLFFHTFELHSEGGMIGTWIGSEAHSLSIDRLGSWSAILALKTSIDTPPGLLIWGGGKGLEFRQLNPQGGDWATVSNRPDTDFAFFKDDQNNEKDTSLLIPLAIVQQRLFPYDAGISRFLLLAYNPEMLVSKRMVALQIRDSNVGYYGYQQGAWTLYGLDDWRGAYYWQNNQCLVALRNLGGNVQYTSIKLNLPDIPAITSTVSGFFASQWLRETKAWASCAETYGSSGSIYLACQRPVQHQQFTGVSCRQARLMYAVSLDAQGRPGLPANTRPIAQLVTFSTVNLPTMLTMDRTKDWLQASQIRITTEFNSVEQNNNHIWGLYYGYSNVNNRDYIQEAFYYAPMMIAARLQQSGYFIEALDWFRKVYDYSKQDRSDRFVFPPLKPYAITNEIDYERLADWLLDPLDIHAIATARPLTDTRFVLISVIGCLLAFADAEFTQDNPQSLVRARKLYLQAISLLDDDILRQHKGNCDQIIGELTIVVGEDMENPDWLALIEAIKRLAYNDLLLKMRSAITEIMATNASPSQKLTRSKIAFERLKAEAETRRQRTVGEILHRNTSHVRKLERKFFSNNIRDQQSSTIRITDTGMVKIAVLPQIDKLVPAPRYTFCIPPNPILTALRFHTELNLYKLRTCRNIAGMERELEPYGAPTDTTSGLPTIGSGGQITLPGVFSIRPTQYRYKVLVERAEQLVGIAQQMEATFLSFLKEGDAERYHLLKARQDAQLARAGIRLQDLRVQEAHQGKRLTQLQKELAGIQYDHYQDLIAHGLLDEEAWARNLLWTSMAFQFGAATLRAGGILLAGAGVDTGSGGTTFGTGSMTAAIASAALDQQVFQGIAGGLSTWSSALSMIASQKRREQEWQFQLNLADKNIQISDQQIILSESRIRITGQEREIARIQVDHAEDVIEFLNTKFARADLYDWMSGVMEGVYRYFLQQATGVARLAENQLAFERQEMPPALIQVDYWDAPRDGSSITNDNGNQPDRRGLTGSARLLQDIYRLDQYAFETDKRKLQLTKTISLARLDPVVFQQFRETGVMIFATPMALFDHDFPGHYLRLIKRIRTSVIALIPPIEGVKATLSTTGISRVVIGGQLFQTTVINRGSDSVALTSPQNATGLFELEMQGQGEMLLPFEGLGVDTTWEFRLPKAANAFDFRTIADVLVTIEYTALDSPIYRQQVIKDLDQTVSADRPFSFRHQFADAWYDLHHPELVQEPKKPLEASFSTRREDFPPNVTELKIEHITLYIAQKTGNAEPINLTLKFSGQDSAGTTPYSATTNKKGIAGTREGNAGSWIQITGKEKSPVGKWTLALEDKPEIRKLFEDDQIEDILFVITFGGKTAEWPQ